jgi:hypothetical protein
MFCSLALSKKLSLIHGNFLIYQDVLHVARDVLGGPRSFLFTYYYFINIDDYEQFPPLGKEEFTSTPAKSFSVPSVDPDTAINSAGSLIQFQATEQMSQ